MIEHELIEGELLEGELLENAKILIVTPKRTLEKTGFEKLSAIVDPY